MGLIPRSLINDFQDIVNQFNEHVDDGGLGRTCVFIFEAGLTTGDYNLSLAGTTSPGIAMSYGGIAVANSSTGQDTTDELADTGTVEENEATKTITARVYAVTQPYLRLSLGVAGSQNVWQLNTHKKYMPDIIRAKEAIFETDLQEKRVRVRLMRPPVPYGLGEAHQCISYWEEV